MARIPKLGPGVYDAPPSAISVLEPIVGRDKAPEALIALVRAGYFIAPRIPTDAMLVAYIDSFGPPPKNHGTVVRNIGKARRRWKAMGDAGTAMALSRRHLQPEGI